ncbi:adenylosuccinate lyase [Portibacter lacus]|uniref:Adenylosuccinate lyase n=1 Tax=Portibacter lacus TaxID=1099794 RepID=A0AA37STC3_9BACT|nr:adenylosuccinate lyase [Portibacter lacus]GLR18411.1 adenylosuccinate lyase [Portibacter lacus]
MLSALSPLDGRYESKIQSLKPYFSEQALIKYRVFVEIKYFLQLCETVPQLSDVNEKNKADISKIVEHFSEKDAEIIKETEKTTNHDVKAVEYFIKEEFRKLGLDKHLEFIHFGLTSQDINNTAFPLMIKDSVDQVMLVHLSSLVERLKTLANEWKGMPMLARTHGQPASPTTLGKEMLVFVERLEVQIEQLRSIEIKAKFGGATGNFNAHKVSYPDTDWIEFGDRFVSEALGLKRSKYTTQIAHYDQLAALFDAFARINTIFIDLARDFWTYISMDYFKQKVIAGEVGSSAMPHKVNPIDFENAEGNFGIANAIFNHLSGKLPISRLQRDLTDSTVLRNVGVPFGHSLIAYQSLLKGLSKVLVNTSKMDQDLEDNWAVVSEAIQNILRREGYEKPYEALKLLTRGNNKITKSSIANFISELKVNDNIKAEMLAITPHNYVGYF